MFFDEIIASENGMLCHLYLGFVFVDEYFRRNEIVIHEETAVLINIANHIVSLTYLRKIKALDVLIIRNDENLNFILIVSPHYS